MADTEKVQVKLEDGDPQSVQDLTGFVPFHVQHVVKSLKSILADICCCRHRIATVLISAFSKKIDICMKA